MALGFREALGRWLLDMRCRDHGMCHEGVSKMSVPTAVLVRTFETGATRNSDKDQFDYEGFLSPAFLQGFAEYMHEHRLQPDGSLRDSDNWQRGIPLDSYMKSAWRHFMDLWRVHRGYPCRESVEDALFGLFFNIQGYYHELEKQGDCECDQPGTNTLSE